MKFQHLQNCFRQLDFSDETICEEYFSVILKMKVFGMLQNCCLTVFFLYYLSWFNLIPKMICMAVLLKALRWALFLLVRFQHSQPHRKEWFGDDNDHFGFKTDVFLHFTIFLSPTARNHFDHTSWSSYLETNLMVLFRIMINTCLL